MSGNKTNVKRMQSPKITSIKGEWNNQLSTESSEVAMKYQSPSQ